MNRILLLLSVFTAQIASAQQYYLFAGTYTNNTGSRGIYVYRFDAATATFDSVTAIFTANPSYLAINKAGNRLYAVNETGREQPGTVSAFAFDRQNGRLSFVNAAPSGGDDPCYISTDNAGKWLAVANYSGGSIGILPLNTDGSINGAALSTVVFEGKNIDKNANAARQEKPHLHTAMFTDNDTRLATADLGSDLLRFFPVNVKKTPLVKEIGFTTKVTSGSGPRHLAFHAKLPVFYAMEELSGTVSVHQIGKNATRQLQRIASDTITPAGTDKGSADIHLSPDGKFLYTSNRAAANTISVFSVNAKTGLLKPVGQQSVMGVGPRNFIIDPSGRFLLVANQRTNNIVVFHRNAATGLLRAANSTLSIPSPVCLKLLAVKAN